MGQVRHALLSLFTSLALAGAALSLPGVPAMVTPAHAQVSAEFQEALEPYGHWERHPRWGEVWVPDDLPPDWRPYEYGHWVYTDEWGWYWISDPEEEDWGWVVYHYGRWARDRQFGWFWIPDDEWGPAWVDWRYGDDYVGWAPLPPDDLIDEYDEQPEYWVFIQPRFFTEVQPRRYFLARERHDFIFRHSHVINRTLRFERRRAAVNPGISPAFVARATHRPLATYKVSPHVVAGTQGVAGAVHVSPQQLRAGRPHERGRKPSTNRVNAVAVQATTATIKPATAAVAPQPLGKNERGRLGTHPPRAAQGGTVAPLTQPAKPTPSLQMPVKPTPAPTVTPQKPPAVTAPQQPRIERHEQPPVVTKPAPPAVTKPVAPPATAKPIQPSAKPVPPPHPAEMPKAGPPKGEPPAKRAPVKPEEKKPNEPVK